MDEQKSIGSYNIKFDASDLVSGIYIYQIKVNNALGGGYTASKKLMLIK